MLAVPPHEWTLNWVDGASDIAVEHAATRGCIAVSARAGHPMGHPWQRVTAALASTSRRRDRRARLHASTQSPTSDAVRGNLPLV